MKYLKMLGLAAVAAAALMAFAGAGTASADEICTVSTNPCPAGSKITEIHASLVGSAKLEDTAGNTLDTCTTGTVKITALTSGATSVTGTIEKANLTWGEKGTTCTFPTTTIGNGSTEATEASGGGSTLTAKSSEVTINTVLFGTCIYGAGTGTHLGSVPNGGSELSINAVINKISGGASCPATTKWNAKYKITNHTAAFYLNN
jgi:hypothetical protein